jgi:hypothetical protein
MDILYTFDVCPCDEVRERPLFVVELDASCGERAICRWIRRSPF